MKQSEYLKMNLPEEDDDVDIEVISNDLEKIDNAFQSTDSKVEELENNKQDAMTFDETPTYNSQNPVKSGGVYSALQNILGGMLNLGVKINNLVRRTATVTVKFDFPPPFTGALAVPDYITFWANLGSATIPSNQQTLAEGLLFYGWTTDLEKATQCLAGNYAGNIPDTVYISSSDESNIYPQQDVTYVNTCDAEALGLSVTEDTTITLYALVMREYAITITSPLNAGNLQEIVAVVGKQTFTMSNGTTTFTLDSDTYPTYKSLYRGLNYRAYKSSIFLLSTLANLISYIGDLQTRDFFLDKTSDIPSGWTFAGLWFNGGEYILNSETVKTDAYGLTSNCELVVMWYNESLDAYTDDPRTYSSEESAEE